MMARQAELNSRILEREKAAADHRQGAATSDSRAAAPRFPPILSPQGPPHPAPGLGDRSSPLNAGARNRAHVYLGTARQELDPRQVLGLGGGMSPSSSQAGGYVGQEAPRPWYLTGSERDSGDGWRGEGRQAAPHGLVSDVPGLTGGLWRDEGEDSGRGVRGDQSGTGRMGLGGPAGGVEDSGGGAWHWMQQQQQHEQQYTAWPPQQRGGAGSDAGGRDQGGGGAGGQGGRQFGAEGRKAAAGGGEVAWGVFGPRGLGGGGGDPVRDASGRPVPDLRAAAARRAAAASAGASVGQEQRDPASQWPWGGDGRAGGAVPSPSRQSPSAVVVGGVAYPWSPGPQSAPAGGQRGGGELGQGQGQGQGRRFMAGLQELRAGPSEEQRRQQQRQRLQLQQDLEEQIRQKKEREAAARAQEEAQRLKEEEELMLYHRRLQAQREGEQWARRRGTAAAPTAHGAEPAAAPPPGQHATAPSGLGPGPGDAGAAGGGARRKPGKHVVDAHWLDAVAPAPAPAPGGQRGQHAGTDRPQVAAAGVESLALRQQQQRWPTAAQLPQGGSLPAVAGTSALVQELRAEQARLREDFSRHSELLGAATPSRRGPGPAAAAAENSRDEAWRELERIRRRLADSEAEASRHFSAFQQAGPEGEEEEEGDEGQFLVSSQLLPVQANTIPPHLGLAAGGSKLAAAAPAAHLGRVPGVLDGAGWYRPVSRAPGPPSLIPPAPRAYPPSR